jgi:hypothetical protein
VREKSVRVSVELVRSGFAFNSIFAVLGAMHVNLLILCLAIESGALGNFY